MSLAQFVNINIYLFIQKLRKRKYINIIKNKHFSIRMWKSKVHFVIFRDDNDGLFYLNHNKLKINDKIFTKTSFLITK